MAGRSPKYDPQREELYRAEKSLRGLSTAEWGRREIKAKVRKWSKQFGVVEPEVVFQPLQGYYGIAEADPDRLTFATDKKGGRSPLTVAHEFAHHVVNQNDPKGKLAFHGPEFVSVLGVILDDDGIVPLSGWHATCDKFGAKYS